MKKIAFFFLIFMTTITFSQIKVISDNERGIKLTPELERLNKKKEKLEKELFNLIDNLPHDVYPYRNIREDEVEAFLARNEAALFYIDSNLLVSKCKDLQALAIKIGNKQEYCHGINTTYKKVKSNIEYAKKRRTKVIEKKQSIQSEKEKEGREVIKHKNTLSNLESELDQEEQLLKQSKQNLQQSQKKSKSLDDFLEEKGVSNSQKYESNSTNLDDFLEGNKSENNSELEDFLDDSNVNDIVTDNEQESSKSSYKLSIKGDVQGVISSKGKILIPYKKWIIKEYRDGIAKVAVLLTERKDNCNNTHTAYKTGFVDNNAQFIDGYTIDFKSIGVVKYFGPLLKINRAVDKTGWTRADYEALERRIAANKRREKREKEEKKRRERIQEAKCERKTVTWKQQILDQYQN